jgi:hypothetical protein
MTDLSHLNALETRLANERDYLARASAPKEIAIRTVWIAQIQKEIASEKDFLGFGAADGEVELTDAELLAELIG